MAVSAGSVIDAIGDAWRRMARILFQPFQFRKWFVLGFCAWLANLADGGCSFRGGGGNGGSGGGSGGPGFGSVGPWFEEHMAVIILIAVAGFVVMLAVGMLVLWLSARGKFMFLDGVLHNRGAVVEPWRRYRLLANSLFWFSVAWVLTMLLVVAIIGAVCVGVAWTDIQQEEFGPAAVAAIVLGIVLLVSFILIAILVYALVDDFVVPVMYLRNRRVMAAWGIFWWELGRDHVWPLVLFYLMKIVLVMGIGIVALLTLCLTCCIAALPYIGTVILLPIFVFMRCYSLCFIERYGPEWRLFALGAAEPA